LYELLRWERYHRHLIQSVIYYRFS